MAKALRLSAWGEACVWLALATAVAMTVALCPHARLAWAAFAFGAVLSIRYGITRKTLDLLDETRAMMRGMPVERPAPEPLSVIGRSGPTVPTAKPSDPVEELVRAAAVPRAGAD